MDKVELKRVLLSVLTQEGISLDQVVIGFGGAMVMLGLRETTSDIDLDVEEGIYHRYQKAGYTEEMGLLGKYISISKEVDIHISAPLRTVVIDGIKCHHPQALLEQYRLFQRHPDRNPAKRDQDARSCALLEKYSKFEV